MKQLFIFTAQWCAPCKALKAVLQDTNVPVDQLRVFDIDTSPTLTKEFDIRSVPTLILFENGSELARKSGAMKAKELIEFCEQ